MAWGDAVIRNRSGRKICTIGVPWEPFVWWSWWKEPERVIRWAWLQSYLIVQSIKEPSLISRQTRCRCVVCGQDSIAPEYGWLWNRGSVVDFRCVNKNCQMFKVTIPIALTMHLAEMPEELFAEILQHLGKEASNAGSEKQSLFVWYPRKFGKNS